MGGVGVGFFCLTPTPDVQLEDQILHHTPVGNSYWNLTISLEAFVETDISCCAPRFPLFLTAKFHSLYVKESESDILPPTPQPCLLGDVKFFCQLLASIT